MQKVVLILVLSIFISIISACSGTNATSAPDSEKNGKPAPETKKNDYPPAPTALMQATLNHVNGNTVKLEDYRGKVLVVNVWATWCGPCRQEIPELIELQTKHQAKGFEVIGLNLDENEDAEMIKDFAKEFEINYDLLRGDSELFKEFYQISKRDAIPQSFLIDREGKLLGVFVGGGPALKKLISSVEKVVGE
jgi:thiol-disulfide isomerase/thioredoxin